MKYYCEYMDKKGDIIRKDNLQSFIMITISKEIVLFFPDRKEKIDLNDVEYFQIIPIVSYSHKFERNEN